MKLQHQARLAEAKQLLPPYDIPHKHLVLAYVINQPELVTVVRLRDFDGVANPTINHARYDIVQNYDQRNDTTKSFEELNDVIQGKLKPTLPTTLYGSVTSKQVQKHLQDTHHHYQMVTNAKTGSGAERFPDQQALREQQTTEPLLKVVVIPSTDAVSDKHFCETIWNTNLGETLVKMRLQTYEELKPLDPFDL